MTYKLKFLPSAKKEWEKLGATVREHLKKKLGERLVRPRVESDRLHGQHDFYKIKLRSAGYRLVYEVEDATVTVFVISVGKREGAAVYRKAMRRPRDT